jgi:Mrp family chromosome partitioning ATPase
MDQAKELFDIIIVDTPPVGSVIDAAIVSKQCDGGILVVKSGNISYRFARKSLEQLEVAGCKILGCVLNEVALNSKGYYGKYYGRYYGRYYGKYYGKYYGNYYGNYGNNEEEE